jgi:predicted glutamine amidotransferase
VLDLGGGGGGCSMRRDDASMTKNQQRCNARARTKHPRGEVAHVRQSTRGSVTIGTGGAS